ncbi:MAG: molybdopterin molybdotransferase MoeA, partial [Campylobacterales bacterium]|nr:molybdopterin molybdotransferase MoeA [Campylobacterales bacterium]
FDNSAMDGYAVKIPDRGKTIKFHETIFAGDNPKDLQVIEGMCHKIMTGAMTPKGCEAVVPFEKVEIIDKNTIKLPDKIKKNGNIRFQGEEIDKKDLIIEKGTLLGAGEIAILASQGISSVKVYKKLKVAVMSSGDEIKEPWDNSEDYQIYNSNSIGIYTFLKELGCEPSYIGALPDDKEKLQNAVRNLKGYDLIVTSGGVSVGEADYTKEVFENQGMKTVIHGIEIKPGKHGMFGFLDKTVMIGLPGNPLSSMSMFLTFVSPIAGKLSGRNAYYPNTARAKIVKDFSFNGNRANVIFGTLSDGKFQATDDYKYSSGMLSPLLNSNCFIIANKGVTSFKKGDKVKVIMPYSFNSKTNLDFITR